MLHYLIYMSSATALMTDQQLVRLLEQSRSWNKMHHLTGMLLYVEGKFFDSLLPHTGRQLQGRFMQVLEGTQTDINNIFSKIEKDDRHHDVLVLKETALEQRYFENWAMGFKWLNLQDDQSLEGFFHLDQDFLKDKALHQSSSPLQFLKSFYQMSESKR